MGNGVLVGVISSDVECPLVILWGTPTGDRHSSILNTLWKHTDINNQPVILNNGDNYTICCSSFWVPPIKTH